MSDTSAKQACCGGAECEPAAGAGVCPVSASQGRAVPRKTPESLLSNPGGLGAGPFYFCPDRDCDVVYFDAAGREVHTKSELNVRVGQKESEDPVPVCYCFEFTRKMLRDELERTGETSIPQRIKAEIAAGRCACEVKNPQGSCCLGNVNRAVREIRDELGEARRTT